MGRFVDVALPVPLDRLFTYAVGGTVPPVGGRVLVPFSGQRLVGVAIRVHDVEPASTVSVKAVQQTLDATPLLSADLLTLAEWIAQYYVAPLGEVLRGMLPLQAEVRRTVQYRITDVGRERLHEGAALGSSRRSRLAVDDQDREYAVLNALEGGDALTPGKLRSTGASRTLLEGMVRKRWLLREVQAHERDARRLQKIAVLVEGVRLPRLNANQTAILAELSAVNGRMPVRDVQALPVPQSTLATLVKRGLVTLEDVPDAFHLGAIHPSDDNLAHEHRLNESQMAALAGVAAGLLRAEFQPFLLYGVTGSGKTAVYLAAMRRALDAGRSALLLVPEIGLTPAMAGQMFAAFGTDVALLHSQLTADERAEQWHRIRRGEARVVVGTRSAVFAPLPNLGLIVVDEEHDSSYKQEETPRYHGRDVAVMRAKLLGIPVVLGSATPSLESWNNAQSGRYTLLRMDRRVADRPLPSVELVDMRAEFRDTGAEHLFSRRLIEEVQATVDRSEQAIILLNRRGYSYVALCRACGERIECENCAIAMTLHKGAGVTQYATPGERLECHYCGFRRTVPERCPKCDSEHLYYFGAGSQQGEERLQELFPAARIGRMDRDTVRGRADMERLLQRLHSGEINLLVGTQMIAKGHDIHGVTTVGVVGCDHALGLPDFRSAERVFQLLTQVSGRAGRGDLAGRVIVQTYHPEHYAVRCAADHDYQGFVRRELQFRRPFHYPPFGVLANVLVRSPVLEESAAWSAALGRWFREVGSAKVHMLGPAAAPLSRAKRIYRFHLLLKAQRRSELQSVIRAMVRHAETLGIPGKALTVDMDPVSLL